MYDLRPRTHQQARAIAASSDIHIHTAALYGAFTVIALIVFGTLSYHPF
jgi:hypothetical protein